MSRSDESRTSDPDDFGDGQFTTTASADIHDSPGGPAADPLTRQLPREAYPLSEQQMAIVEAVIGNRLDVTVHAKAGSGKTSTLEALARRFEILDSSLRIRYVAFNTSVRQEADKRMPRNVVAKTGHALAWAWAGPALAGKVKPEAASSLGERAIREAKYLRSRPDRIAGVMGLIAWLPTYADVAKAEEYLKAAPHPRGTKAPETVGKVSPADQVEIIQAVVARYANSADDHVEDYHFITVEGADLAAGLLGKDRAFLLNKAREYWEDLRRPLGRGCQFKANFDHLRKMWALSRPDFKAEGFDILFLDEAQDTPPVVARVVGDQRDLQRVLVGDPHQAVYGWAGAKDFLETTDIDLALPLTTSYRFGPRIARGANRFLTLLGSEDMVIGAAEGDSIGVIHEPDAIITRTNLGMLGEIVKVTAYGARVAVLDGTKRDLRSLVDTAAWLMSPGKGGAPEPEEKHEAFSRFGSWLEVEGYITRRNADPQVRSLYKIITKHGVEALDAIVRRLVPVKEGSARGNFDVIAITAHKAKGLEWDTVRVGDDFPQPVRGRVPDAVELPSDEELRLAYVVITRAKRRLDPGSLRWVIEFTPHVPTQEEILAATEVRIANTA